MRRPAKMQLPRVGAVPFGVVERRSDQFGAYVCSPFAPPPCSPAARREGTAQRFTSHAHICGRPLGGWADVYGPLACGLTLNGCRCVPPLDDRQGLCPCGIWRSESR